MSNTPKIDELLKCNCNADKYVNGSHYNDCPKAASDLLYQLLNEEVIGKTKAPFSRMGSKNQIQQIQTIAQNNLREEQRTRLNKLFGKE
jgi:hypothetical protein